MGARPSAAECYYAVFFNPETAENAENGGQEIKRKTANDKRQ